MTDGALVRNNDSASHSDVIIPAPLAFREIRCAPRVIVTVHIANDVCSDVGVSGSSRTSCTVFVSLHLVVFDSNLDRIAVSSPSGEFGIGVIGINHTYLIVDSRLSHLLRELRIRIGYTHREPEFQRVGKFNPILDITAVDCVRLRGKVVGTVRYQHFDSCVQFFEHSLVNVLLRIVRHAQTAVKTDFRIRNRTVSIGNSVHCSNFHYITHRENHRIGSNLMKLFVVGIDYRNNPVALHKYIGPVVRRIVVGYSVGETGICVSHIAAQSSTQQTLSKLSCVHIRRNHAVGDAHKRCPDNIAVPLHLVIRNTVRILVQFLIIGGASDSGKCNSRQGNCS